MSKMPDAAALKAKRILFGLFVAWFVVDALLVAISGKVPGVLRLILTLLLMYYVFQGRTWARKIMIGLFSLGVIVCIGFGLWYFRQSSTAALIIIGFGAAIAVIPAFMVLSKDLKKVLGLEAQQCAPLIGSPRLTPEGPAGAPTPPHVPLGIRRFRSDTGICPVVKSDP